MEVELLTTLTHNPISIQVLRSTAKSLTHQSIHTPAPSSSCTIIGELSEYEKLFLTYILYVLDRYRGPNSTSISAMPT